MNKSFFKIKMIMAHDSVKELAVSLGISPNILYSKINGKSEFKQGEIVSIRNRWNLTAEETEAIFFAD